MKKLMKRLKTYDIENIVRNTLLILMTNFHYCLLVYCYITNYLFTKIVIIMKLLNLLIILL